MNVASRSDCRSYGWLDSLAIGASLICAVHCLLTPILIVCLPIIATTVWVHEDFHLWMILFVVPTTGAAVFMGCRKHKDKAVPILGMIGLACLIAVAVYETLLHSGVVLQTQADCASCASCASGSGGSVLTAGTSASVLGGIFLTCAHVRNFLLCRKANCTHD